MAVTSTFTPSAGILSTFGDSLNNNITVSRDTAGKLLVNVGAVKVLGGTPTVANTSLIQVFGQTGNDTITLNEANGALPRANLFGGLRRRYDHRRFGERHAVRPSRQRHAPR